jgi:FHA domain
MATFTCPDGHDSTAGDYCDVCGAPIAAGAAASVTATAGGTTAGGRAADSAAADSAAVPAATPPPLPVAAPGRTCPNCDASNIAAALFCESCGYDFTTGQLPRPLDPPSGLSLDPVTPASGAAVPAGSAGPAGSSVVADPATPSSGTSVPAAAVAAPASSPSGPAASAPAASAPQTVPPDADAVAPWVVEIWVDADWYAGQDVPEACPSPGMPTVVVLRERSVLVGRRSISRGITPEIEISGDTGVSRRHAQLTTDGQRWWVEDLQSANGTYLGAAGKPLPENPITPGQRVELAEDGRVYVGGWTRLVVREATPGDLIAPYGS